MEEIPHEFLYLKEYPENGSIGFEYKITGNIKIDPEKIALCDICGAEICQYKDLNQSDLVQPETIARAFKNGMPIDNPIFKRLKNTLRGREKKEFEDMIKKALIDSETPWAVCHSCIKKVQKYQKKG